MPPGCGACLGIRRACGDPRRRHLQRRFVKSISHYGGCLALDNVGHDQVGGDVRGGKGICVAMVMCVFERASYRILGSEMCGVCACRLLYYYYFCTVVLKVVFVHICGVEANERIMTRVCGRPRAWRVHACNCLDPTRISAIILPVSTTDPLATRWVWSPNVFRLLLNMIRS